MELVVHNDFYRNSTSIYLQKVENGRKEIIGIKDGKLVATILDNNNPTVEPIPALFECSTDFAQDFIKAVVDYAQ